MSIASLLQKGVLLKDHSTFGIGGPALLYAEIKNLTDLKEILNFCNNEKLPYFVLGRGSNCLFADLGFNGVVIHNKIDFKNELSNGVFHVGAGFNFSLLGSQTAMKGFTGLEFASGIPGSVGGAVFMNAGANGRETKDSLFSVDFMQEDGKIITFDRKDLDFSYRFSPFQKMKGVITAATFSLEPLKEARQNQLAIIQYRKKSQPYNEKSAGCVFRNPTVQPAGALIDSCGLKGLKMGGASISTLHANFITNTENASCEDVKKLIQSIQEQVLEKSGVELEREIRYIPYEGGIEHG